MDDLLKEIRKHNETIVALQERLDYSQSLRGQLRGLMISSALGFVLGIAASVKCAALDEDLDGNSPRRIGWGASAGPAGGLARLMKSPAVAGDHRPISQAAAGDSGQAGAKAGSQISRRPGLGAAVSRPLIFPGNKRASKSESADWARSRRSERIT